MGSTPRRSPFRLRQDLVVRHGQLRPGGGGVAEVKPLPVTHRHPVSSPAIAIECKLCIEVTRARIILVELNQTGGRFKTVENRLPVISWSSGPPTSLGSQLAQARRGFRLLEELGTRPRVVYLKEADA
jgi:hypothetical protein